MNHLNIVEEVLKGELNPDILLNHDRLELLSRIESAKTSIDKIVKHYLVSFNRPDEEDGTLQINSVQSYLTLFPNIPEWLQSNSPALFDQNDKEIDTVLQKVYSHLPNASQNLQLYRAWQEYGHLKIIVFDEEPLEKMPLSELAYSYLCLALRQQFDYIINAIREKIFALQKEKKVGQFIKNLHLDLTRSYFYTLRYLPDDSVNQLYNAPQSYGTKSFYALGALYCEKTIRYLDKNHEKYIEKETQVPLRTFEERLKNLKPVIDQTIDLLPSLKTPEFIQTFLLEVKSQLSNKSSTGRTTYGTLDYLDYFWTNLNQWLYDRSVKPGLKEWTYKFIEVNINHFDFMYAYTSHIKDTIAKMDNAYDQVDLLSRVNKWCMQVSCNSIKKYDENGKDLSIMIKDWCAEEIQYIKQQMELSQNLTEDADQVKIQLNMSQKTLLAIARACYETNIIEKKTSKKQMIRMLVKTFQTEGKNEDLSEDSMYSKYFNTDKSRNDKAISILIDLVNFLKS